MRRFFGAIEMGPIASESDSSPLPGHSQVTFHAHAKYWMGEWAVGAKQTAPLRLHYAKPQ